MSLTKNETQSQQFFSLQTHRLGKFFEHLNSSLAKYPWFFPDFQVRYICTLAAKVLRFYGRQQLTSCCRFVLHFNLVFCDCYYSIVVQYIMLLVFFSMLKLECLSDVLLKLKEGSIDTFITEWFPCNEIHGYWVVLAGNSNPRRCSLLGVFQL